MISAVHEVDRVVWRAIDHGERPIDWNAWFGHPDGADYLTEAGKRAMRRATGDLTDFFGSTWLDRAIQPNDGHQGPRIQGLGASSPVLALAPARRAGAYVESIRWWASLQLLVGHHVQGYQKVRRDVRNDLTTHRLLHTLAQARLAAIGAYLGADVAVEPGKQGGPGDVLLRTANQEVFLEIVTFGPDPTREQDEAHHERHWLHLTSLGRGKVYWEGYVPGFLNKADEAKWLQATTAAAEQCQLTGQPVELPGPEDQRLTVRPGSQPPGTGTTGPYLNLDFSARLAGILDRKGAQTRGAGVAWIWIEDHGGVHPLHPFFKTPLAPMIRELGHIVRSALADRSHVAGAAWSRAEKCWPPVPDEQAEEERGLAFQRGLPVEHLRRTIIVNRSLILPGQTRLLAQACDREPLWLDWALAQLGIKGGVKSLLSHPPQRPTSRLWTPPVR